MSVKYVLLSGAAGGIGQAAIRLMTEAGFTVFAGALNVQEISVLQQLGNDKVIPIELDIGSNNSISAAITTIQSKMGEHGQLYALINNAGVNFNAPLKYISEDEIRLTINVNFAGTVFLTKAAIPLLEGHDSRLIITSSAMGLMATPTISVYAASKFALEGLGDSLRVELAAVGIKVSLVEPGVIQTPMTKAAPKILETMLSRMSVQDRNTYETSMQKIVDMSAAPGSGSPPEAVAKLMLKALKVNKPKARYQAGSDSKTVSYLRHLPDCLKDFMQRKLFNL